MRNLVTLFGADQAYRLDSSEWTKDLESLNQSVELLGFYKAVGVRYLYGGQQDTDRYESRVSLCGLVSMSSSS